MRKNKDKDTKELVKPEKLFRKSLLKKIIKSNKILYRFLFRLKNNNRYIFALRNFWKNTDSLFKAIEIETYPFCNRKCSFCPINTDKSPKKIMSDQLFDKILEELKELHFHGAVSLTNYGEPLLDKRLVSFIRRIKSALGSRIEFFSNGDFLTKELLDEFISAGIDLITVSQHGQEPSAALKKLFSEITPAEKKHLFFQVINESTEGLTNRGGSVDIESINPMYGMHCGLQTITVRADGEISLCCEDYYNEVGLGNVNKSNLIDIWDSPAYRRIRNKMKIGIFYLPICKRCRGEILSSKK